MDHVEVFVADEDRESVLQALEERDVSFAVTAGGGPHEDRSMVSFAVQPHGVEDVLSALVDAGLDEDAFTVVTDPRVAESRTEDELRDRYARTPHSFTAEALDSIVWDRRRATRSYLLLMVLSAGIATIGLLTSTPAIIVGSMVITPLLTPILATSVGAVLGDGKMARQGITSQVAGIVTSAAVAAALASAAKGLGLVPATLAVTDLPLVAVRLSPGVLPLVVGVLAGAAAGYGLATKEFVLLAGVAIAGALVPAAAVVGIGLAWGNWTLALGATVLVVVTMLTINVSAAGSLWLTGYRPETVDLGLPSGRRAVIAVAAIALLGAVLFGVAVGTVQQADFERTVNEETDAVLEEPAYDGLGVVEVDVEYQGAGATGEPERVTITVTRPADADHPPVAEPVQARLAEAGYDVTVRVRYQEYERAEG